MLETLQLQRVQPRAGGPGHSALDLSGFPKEGSDALAAGSRCVSLWR